MLDIGAGGGSLGVLMKRAYDITTVASAFADWPVRNIFIAVDCISRSS
jgi:precorrin-6B methylase 2